MNFYMGALLCANQIYLSTAVQQCRQTSLSIWIKCRSVALNESKCRLRHICCLLSSSQRYPGQVTLKSQRLRQAQTRRKAGATQPPTPTDTPPILETKTTKTQVASVQTDDCSASSLVLPEASAASSVGFLSLPVMDAATEPRSPLSPPPPPPPPPPPFCDDTGSKEPKDATLVKQLQQPSADSLTPLGPCTGRYFDSSQLLNARRKLRKTTSLEASHWRRG